MVERLLTPMVIQYRRVEIFTRVLTVDKRTQVLSSFSDSESPVKLIVSTSAFGMGVDICDIRRIIHWGLPTTIEGYVQEVGRAGRDGKDCVAILYVKGGKHFNEIYRKHLAKTICCPPLYQSLKSYQSFHDPQSEVRQRFY